MSDELDHLIPMRVRENRESQDVIELQAKVRNCQIRNTVRIKVRAVTVVVNKMGARELLLSLFDSGLCDIQTPVIIVVNVVAGAV